MDRFEREGKGQVRVMHILSHPDEGWKGERGHVDEERIRKRLWEPGEGRAVFLCGPPAMIQKAALPALRKWGYTEDVDCFGF